MPDGPIRRVTIFVSSPTDVMAERERAARVIDRLQSRFREHVRLAPIFFEEKYYTADKGFQEQIRDAAATDLVVSIFWSRLGSELPPDVFGTMADGQPYPGGAVYELLRALAAKREKNVPDILVYRKVADTGVSVTDADQRRLMTAQLDAFEAFWRRWFVSAEGHFRAGYQMFKSADEFERLLEGHLRAWLDEHGLLGTEVVWRIAERGSPFRGLEPYEAQHADVYFGREREVDRGRARLLEAAARGTAFLLVMGPSGAGKSSLARAGLVSRLTQPGDIDGVDVVRVAVMRPGEAATPQRSLADALFRTEALPELAGGDFGDPERLAAALTSEANVALAPILRVLERVAERLEADKRYDRPVVARLLLVVDQLEESFSGALDDAARSRFVRLIAALARSGSVLVIATLRSSSYGAVAREPELVALKDAGATLDVAVPGPEVLAEVVRRPAAAAGLAFDRRGDERLDDVVLAAAGGNADALPLLGFTLRRLYEARDGQRLTFAAYDELGGLEGAIGRAAEQAFSGADASAQGTLPQMLRGLAEAPRQGAGFALRDLPLAAAAEGTPLRRLADALAAARVLHIHGEGQGAVLRLAHDAVLRGWERARNIVTREQDFYRIRADVTAAERRWRKQQRPDLLLAPGLPLAEAQSLRATYGADLAPDLVAFIDASKRKQQWRQRRGYALAAVFGVVAIAAILAGFLAWRQQQIAEEQSRIAKFEAARAERNFGAAKSTIDAVIFDLAEGLWDVEGMRVETVRRILGRAEAAIAQLASRTDDDPEVRASQAAMFSLFADTYLRLGDTQLAAEYAREATDIVRALAAKDPGNTKWQRDFSVGLNKIGDVLRAQGDLSGALAAYREGLDIMRALAARDPGNAGWRRDMAVSLDKVGDVLVVQGDLSGALAAYRETLDIARALAAEDPTNTQWRRDVSVSLIKVGDVLAAQGDLSGALAVYREGLDIRRALAGADPGNAGRRRDVSVSLWKLGDVLVAQGDLAGALAAFREALDIGRALFAKDPDNTGWRHDVSLSLERVGDVRRAQGDLGGALAAYRESLDIRRALAAKDPGNTEWRRDLSVMLGRVGEVLAAQGDLAGALAAYREVLDTMRVLAARDPGNAGWRRDVVVSLWKVGDALRAQGDFPGALTAYREGLDIARALAAKDPGNTLWRYDVALGLERVGDVLRAQGDLPGALAAYRELLDTMRALAAKDPDKAGWRRDVVVSLWKVGDVLAAQGDLAGALAAYRESLDILRELTAKDPGNTQWRRDVFLTLNTIGDVLRARSDLPGALAAYRESLDIVRALAAKNPSNTQWQDDLKLSIDRIGGLAYYQVLARDFATALETADLAISLAPDLTWLHSNRAHALMFLGRADEARAIYLQYRGEKIQGVKPWETAILEDFAELRKAGLAHSLMDEIETLFAGRT